MFAHRLTIAWRQRWVRYPRLSSVSSSGCRCRPPAPAASRKPATAVNARHAHSQMTHSFFAALMSRHVALRCGLPARSRYGEIDCVTICCREFLRTICCARFFPRLRCQVRTRVAHVLALLPNRQSCTVCIARHCDEDLIRCSGLTPRQLPFPLLLD